MSKSPRKLAGMVLTGKFNLFHGSGVLSNAGKTLATGKNYMKPFASKLLRYSRFCKENGIHEDQRIFTLAGSVLASK